MGLVKRSGMFLKVGDNECVNFASIDRIKLCPFEEGDFYTIKLMMRSGDIICLSFDGLESANARYNEILDGWGAIIH